MGDLLVFIHVFKCGGSSLCGILNSNMEKINIKKNERLFIASTGRYEREETDDIMLWEQKWRKQKAVNKTFESLENIKFIGGHINLKHVKNTFSNRNLKTFCSFRNPILRNISGIIYIEKKKNKKLKVENVINTFKNRVESKKKINIYCNYFGARDTDSIKKDIDDLSCILILEDFDNSLKKLSNVLDSDKNKIKIKNIVKNTSKTSILSTTKVYDIIKKDTNLVKNFNDVFKNEIIIYNYAVNKYNEKYNCNIEEYK